MPRIVARLRRRDTVERDTVERDTADVDVVVGAALVRGDRVLAAQRTRPAHAAGRWELPGGAVEPGEDEPSALARECVEELALTVTVGERVGPDVELPGGRVLRIYRCASDGVPVAREHAALRWVGVEQLAGIDWLPTDRVVLPALAELLGATPPEPS